MDNRTPHQIGADIAFNTVAEREGLPQPGKRYDGVPLDYEESEGLEFLTQRPAMGPNEFAILLGLLLGVGAVMGIGLIKAWPWISTTAAGWFA